MVRRDKIRLWSVLIVVVVAIVIISFQDRLNLKLNLGLDLRGGAHIVLQAVGTEDNPATEDSIERLLAVIRNRVDQYGVAEPLIQRSGTDRVIVDLPGIQDPQAALELIGKTANLEFREVISGSEPPPPPPQRQNYDSDEQFALYQERWRAAAELSENAKEEFEKRLADIPGGIVSAADPTNERTGTSRYYLLGPFLVGGRDLIDARPQYDSIGRIGVSLKFNADGALLFDTATSNNIGKQIAIVLDGVTFSAPVVQERISGGEAQITGNFSTDEANRLAIMLRAGALPVAVEIAENRSVGPSLGADSIKSGVEAGIAGAVMVLIFMFLFYLLRGFAANIALAVAMLLIFAGMALFRATLTLPGIAGIVLTLGMAVDGNILIYERIKEEAKTGKTPVAALDAGFRKALVTILDANITTLIAGIVLFYFGSGPVKGFGVTLSIGLVASTFCNVVVTRSILQLLTKNKPSAKPATVKR
ncbi:MAG: protein translocase subunit SecD [Synergistaceae bacterium]|nr:protein translocase subunit SecD [Synergistaceae bacterium]